MRSAESIKQSNEMRDKIIDILEQNQGMKAVYPLLHYFESQFREPSTQGGERHKKEVDDAWIAGVMSERSAAKDEIERLKQEIERKRKATSQRELEWSDLLSKRNNRIQVLEEGIKELLTAFNEYAEHRREKGSSIAKVKRWNNLVFKMQALNPKD